MQLQGQVDLRTLQTLLGHKDLGSTMRYLKPARDERVLQQVNRTFGLRSNGSGGTNVMEARQPLGAEWPVVSGEDSACSR
jgi:hypothetical protein